VLLVPAATQPADPALERGLETLLSDHLEVLAGAAVVPLPAVPAGADLERLPEGTFLMTFRGRREGDRLDLATAWTTRERLKAGDPWAFDDPGPLLPADALARWVDHWPLRRRFPGQEALFPRDPAHGWDLLQVLSIRDDGEAAWNLAGTRALAKAESGCATVWTALGDHLYRSLWVDPEAAGSGFNARMDQAFARALELVPGHPRATYLRALMLTDIGDQRRALQSLIPAAHQRPDVPDLYLGFAYAGRTAGLLEGARRALARRQRILGALADPSPWSAETTYLYLGDTAAFAQDLERARTTRTDAGLLFYQGYLVLLKGQRDLALRYMTEGSGLPGGPIPFQDLCRAYRALLEGRPQDGLAGLRAVDQIRGRLRIPDGEWTFKEAEAYAQLGDADRGVDAATRAFVQGFSCARWYEASPFLAAVRVHPRWPTLHRNVLERQAILEADFPASAFTP
jgi:tetratricopeptide (TPR) repeat protein